MPEVYCVKCKAKREAIETKKVTMKNGKPALEGKCPVCGDAVCDSKSESCSTCAKD